MSLKKRLEELERQQEEIESQIKDVYLASLEALPDDKVCADFLAEDLSEDIPFEMEFPIEVSGIEWINNLSDKKYNPVLVAITPCDCDQTYIGIMMGNLPLGVSTTYHNDAKTLTMSLSFYNPAIVVPSLGRIVMGCESYWRRIRDINDFYGITSEDIQNVWYIKELKKMIEE